MVHLKAAAGVVCAPTAALADWTALLDEGTALGEMSFRVSALRPWGVLGAGVLGAGGELGAADVRADVDSLHR